ncbi:recombinase family protein [Silicimonas algicola]|uniref:Resolvase-like protein n=1 Tax=Silicimonas algicola TaxID=1826607 RepID=A0A316G2I8_9RHOB|nr:recombinase family protein [Silicimonas algicola]PWK54605.1 resolvase-like protein [Silicimonas algicola]
MAANHVRCAIYTRKSSDEGLDQNFNSLDAQHEACAAYIASQKHEGWKMLPTRYDDGGVSGGTLERPALQRLIADIEARRVDMVVVYKIDRLTRSLADFAKLVERLDACDCSFVSVTQAFNTSSSMGRHRRRPGSRVGSIATTSRTGSSAADPIRQPGGFRRANWSKPSKPRSRLIWGNWPQNIDSLLSRMRRTWLRSRSASATQRRKLQPGALRMQPLCLHRGYSAEEASTSGFARRRLPRH